MEKLRINFVLPPIPRISGGPLAILEYANRFAARGHAVSVTTYPDNQWEGDNPFPWFKLNGDIFYKRMRDTPRASEMGEGHRLVAEACGPDVTPFTFETVLGEWSTWLHTIQVIPDCDINIATLWSTVFPVFYSRKGKPVFFMQHYEEVFFNAQEYSILRLLARAAMALPVYKVANSSWLQKEFAQRFGQMVPYSNNAIDQGDFAPAPKLSAVDGRIRVITYSRPEDWKGFGDAVAAMMKVRERHGAQVEWHVFGYAHDILNETNPWASYKYHPKLSFKDLSRLYATSDIALCPSWYESFPLPPLEAMASGTAPVTTALGTEDYAFDGVNALVVGSRDIDGMAAAISRLIDDAGLRARLAAKGLETAAAYTWDRAVEERERILLDIHQDRVSYDRFAGVNLGIKDPGGRDFERAPADADTGEGLFWSPDNRLFLIHDGVRRHVVHGELVPVCVERGWTYVELDGLQFVRTPVGAPVVTVSEIPYARASPRVT